MKNIYGNQPVSGDDFYGREDIVRHLKGILISQNSFLLLGLRRIGKSSTIKEVSRQIVQEFENIIIVNLNCQTYENIQDFYRHLHLALPTTWRESLRQTLKNSKRIPNKIIDAITDHIEEIEVADIGKVKLRNDTINYSNAIKEELTDFFKKQQKHIILIVDELPFLFENIAEKNLVTTKSEIEMILSTLRSWRDIGISEVICGSLNLHHQLDSFGISRKLLGGITTQNIPNYTKEEAVGIFKKLAQSSNIKLNDEHIEEILKLIPDYIPQFLQYFFFNLKTHWNGDINKIKLIYNKYVYPGILKDFEYQFIERYAKFAEEDLQYVSEALNIIIENPKIKEADLLKQINTQSASRILLMLTNQEFIVLDENQSYNFSYNIIRNWWHKKNL